MPHRRHDRVLDDLRAQIAGVERSGRPRRPALPFDVDAIDDHLPERGLTLGALHEIGCGGPELGHTAAAALFAAGLLARLKGPVLWCLPRRDLFAAALAGAGLHPDRVIYAETRDEAGVLPVAEEALRFAGLAGVVAEVTRLGLTPSRRLQLAAETSGVTMIALRRWPRRGEAPAEGTTAVTRWRVTALASTPLRPGQPGVGRPRWHLELTRCRGGEPAAWIVEACDGAGRLRLAADLADRSAETAPRRATG